MPKAELKLSSTSRKALCVQVGESAGLEIANFLHSLAERLEQLERTKVNVTPIAPPNSINLLSQLVDQLSSPAIKGSRTKDAVCPRCIRGAAARAT